MSSDLLAEFDTFYRAPQNSRANATPPSKDLSFLNDANTKGNGQSTHSEIASQWQNPSAQLTVDIWGNPTNFQPNTQASAAAATAHDDIWGVFQGAAETRKPQIQQAADAPALYGEPPLILERNTTQDKPGIIRRPTLDLFSSNIDMVRGSVPAKSNMNPTRLPPQKPPVVSQSSHGEVLFDADEMFGELGDDDFGEFESVMPDPPSHAQPLQPLSTMFSATSLEPKATKRPTNLLSTTTNMNGILPYPQAPKSPSFQERNPFADLGLSTKSVSDLQKEGDPNQPSPVTAWPTFEIKIPKPDLYKDSPAPNSEIDDEWGDFSDLPAETPVQQTIGDHTGIEADAWAWDSADQVTESASAHNDAPPPTNIPPPSVLLTLFPSVFDLPQSVLFKPVANQPFSLKNRIISDPSTIEFLRAYLTIATVAARIVAGRKLRWKRDTLLFQAMKIGQAAAGGKSGMKLAGVDKAEVTREDRETAEVVRVWKEQLGRLRSAVAIANSGIQNPSQHLAIPDVSESMHIRTQERAATAPKACLICGLKREERVNKVDVDVEDSFGEWWIDHWGHRACRNFWLEHEAKLRHH